MRLAISGTFAVVAAALVIGSAPGEARAQTEQPEGDEDDPGAEEPGESTPKEGIEGGGFDDYETAEEKQAKVAAAEYGVGVRVRTIYVPKFLLELFVEKASSGVFKPGFGLEVSRRKGNFELVIGAEYENVSPDDGFWLDKGDDPNVPEEAPDYLEFDNLSWVTADVAFLFNAAFNDRLSFRYGAGLGIGVVIGEVLQTDSTCVAGTGEDDIEENCMENPNGEQVNDPADLPPVFPVVNLIMGLQFRPIDKLTINLETGIRTVGFFGLSSTYYF
jgi:hypothetical protein